MLQKYFIAIIPPEPLMVEIKTIKESISKNYHSHGALQSPAHITLHLPFIWNDDKENKLIGALENFKFNQPFSIALKNYNCFEPRVIFIEVEKNDTLFLIQQQLVSHVKKHLQIFNQSDNLRGFHPHITIAFRDLKKQTFYRVWEEYKMASFSANFNCTEFILFKKERLNWIIYKTFSLI